MNGKWIGDASGRWRYPVTDSRNWGCLPGRPPAPNDSNENGAASKSCSAQLFFGAVVVDAEAAADHEVLAAAASERAPIRRIGEAKARSEMIVMVVVTGRRTTFVAWEKQADRRGGIDGGLLAGAEAVIIELVEVLVHQRRVDLITGAVIQRQIRPHLPTVLRVQIVFVGAKILKTAAVLHVIIRNAQQEIRAGIAGAICPVPPKSNMPLLNAS